MDEQLTKSLTDLIDETLSELEELRKSKMSAAEIKIEGPGEGIAGKPSDGELDAKKAEDEEEEDEEEEKAEKSEDEEDEEEEEVEKGDDDPADHPDVKRKVKKLLGKAEDKAEEEEEEEEKVEKASDKKEPHKDDPKHEAKEKKLAQELLDMHKSTEEMTSLMKGYVEERIQPLEQKLATILELVNSIADQPVAPKGVTVKTAPLMKSNAAEYGETLSKAEVANKLFELKKSGTRVDSLDIAKAEMGQDLANIVKKYEIS